MIEYGWARGWKKFLATGRRDVMTWLRRGGGWLGESRLRWRDGGG